MTVYNKLVARAFRRIAALLQIRGDDAFKIRAYQRAAETLHHWPEDIRTVWRAGRLTDLPHIGPALAKKVDELLRTGRLAYLERLEAEVPPDLLALLALPGLGPSRVRALWQQLGLTSAEALHAALLAGRVRGIRGLGPRTLQRLQQALETRAAGAPPLRLDAAWGLARTLVGHLLAHDAVSRAAPTGAMRRWEALVPRVQVLAAAETRPPAEALTADPLVHAVQQEAPHTWTVTTALDCIVQVHWTQPHTWGAAWLATTGPEAHWAALQAHAAARGLRLTRGGLFGPAGRPLPASSEAQVYAALDLPWIPPCARGWALPLEQPQAWARALAALLPWDVPRQAELHTHTTWSDGHLDVRALARAALDRGLRVLAITDHSVSLKVAGGLSADDLARQRATIAAVQADIGSGLRLLQGAEVDILPDGRLDYPDEVLAQLDVVIASPHQALEQDPAEATARLLRAVQHPRVHILGHPTGRLLPRRAGLAPDMTRLVRAAAEHGVALEINANPHRLDLRAAHARLAVQAGAWLSIDTDAHRAAELDYWPYGLAVARRAGAAAAQVLNTWPPERLLQHLAHKRGAA